MPRKPLLEARLLGNNLLIYVVGGLIAPLIGLKLINMLLAALRLAQPGLHQPRTQSLFKRFLGV
jgi:hypothetical protein